MRGHLAGRAHFSPPWHLPEPVPPSPILLHLQCTGTTIANCATYTAQTDATGACLCATCNSKFLLSADQKTCSGCSNSIVNNCATVVVNKCECATCTNTSGGKVPPAC